MSNMKYTLESLLGQMKSATKVGKTINKNNIYRSRELCKDLMKLSRCKSMESIDAYLKEKDNEIVALEYFTQNWYVTTVKEINIAANLMADSMSGGNKYGAEAFKIYQASLEGANVPGKVGAFFDKIWKGFKAWLDKVGAWFMGIVRKCEAFIKNLFLNGYAKFYKSFDASKFQNVNAKIKAPKYDKDIANKVNHDKPFETFEARMKELDQYKSYTADQLMSEEVASKFNSGPSMSDEEVIKKVNNQFYGSEEKPKSQEMTVSEFFGGASAGQKPAMLEMLSESSVKTFREELEMFKKGVKVIQQTQKSVGTMVKTLKSKGDEAKDAIKNFQAFTKSLSSLISMMKTKTYYSFNQKVTICGHIKHAASVGCGKVKEDKKDKKEETK